MYQSLDLKKVLENAVESMNANIDKASFVSAYMVEGEEAVLMAHKGFPDWFAERAGRIPYPKGATWKTIIQRKPRYIADTDQDTSIGSAGKESGIKSYLSIPVKLNDEAVGTLSIASHEKNAFDTEELEFLEVVVQQIEIAVGNAKQAEAFRISREKFRNLVEQINDWVWEIDRDGRFTYVSPKARQISGYDSGEVIGKTTLDFMSPEEAERFAGVIGGFISRQAAFNSIEKSLIHKDGSTVFCETSGSPIFDDKGAFQGYRGVARDITGRKNREAMLRESEEKYRTLVEHTYELIVVVSSDGRFLYVSPRHKDLLGYEPDELAGRNIFENVYPGDRSAVMSEFQKTILTRSSGQCVFRYRHKNGEWHWLESSGKPFMTQTGETRALIVSRDITERRTAEEALRESEEKYRTLAEQIYDLICETDTDGRFLNVSFRSRDIAGYEPGELIMSRDFFELIHPDDLQAVTEEFRRTVEIHSSLPGRAVHRYRHKNGKWCWFGTTAKPYRTAAGETRVLIVSRDITDRITAEQALQNAHDELEMRVLERTVQLTKIGEELTAEIAERRRAEEKIKDSYEQMRALTAHLQSVREDERTKISREIHDELGQALTGLKMDLSWLGKQVSKARTKSSQAPLLDKFEAMSVLIDDTIQSVRRIATELRPGVLDDLGLAAAIEWQTQDFQKRTGILCDFRSNVDEVKLNRESSTAVFRIFQETLTNVARHAKATRVSIALIQDAEDIILKVQDNGKGFVENDVSGYRSLGILGMKERALLLGGEISITGCYGQGTTVLVNIPVERLKL